MFATNHIHRADPRKLRFMKLYSVSPDFGDVLCVSYLFTSRHFPSKGIRSIVLVYRFGVIHSRRSSMSTSNNATKYLRVDPLSAPSNEMADQRSARPASYRTTQKLEIQVSGAFQTVNEGADFVAQVHGMDFEQWEKQENRLKQISPKLDEYSEIDYGYDTVFVETFHAKQDIHHSGSIGCPDLEAIAAALEESAMRPEGHFPTSPPILYHPPFHRSVWRVGDEDEAAHKPRRGDRGRRCSLPASMAKWSSALQEGIETLSAIQMVGGTSDQAWPLYNLRRLKSLPPSPTM